MSSGVIVSFIQKSRFGVGVGKHEQHAFAGGERR